MIMAYAAYNDWTSNGSAGFTSNGSDPLGTSSSALGLLPTSRGVVLAMVIGALGLCALL